MKKENRKIAQQRRAKERQKKAFFKKLKRILSVAIPLLVIALLILFLFLTSGSASQKSSSSEDTTAAAASSSGSATSYSTDTSLTVKDGDTVNIDYVGTIDGTEFEGGSTDGAGTDLVIGSGSYIDGFEEQLIGTHPGDTVDVNVTFPSDYGVENLNGKNAVFTVTVNGIYE